MRVPAGREGLELIGDLGRRDLIVGAREFVDADGLPREVTVDVGVAIAGTQIGGAGAGDLEHLVGERTGMVLTAGVSLTEEETLHVVGHDVGNTVAGTTNGGLVDVLVLSLLDHGGGAVRLGGGTVSPTRAGRDHHEGDGGQ